MEQGNSLVILSKDFQHSQLSLQLVVAFVVLAYVARVYFINHLWAFAIHSLREPVVGYFYPLRVGGACDAG